MRQVGEFFSRPVDRVLYHYTGIGSLLAIVESRKLWASHAYYLNDSQELLYGCDLLRVMALGRVENADPTDVEFLSQLVKWLETFRDTAYHIYFFSLSEEASLLSQWRSYTPHGKGISIGFAPERIQHLVQTSGFRIAKCIYESAAQKDLMSVLLDLMLTTHRQQNRAYDSTKEHPSQKYFRFLEQFRGDFLQVLAIVKHSAFQEEREWRVISPYFQSYTVPQIRFREGASMLVPFIELELAQPGEEGPIFEEVVLGPSQHGNLSMAALSNFLSNKRVCTSTRNCAIPYREW